MSFIHLNIISDFIVTIFNLFYSYANISHAGVCFGCSSGSSGCCCNKAANVNAKKSTCRSSVCDNLIKNLIFVCMRCKLLLLKFIKFKIVGSWIWNTLWLCAMWIWKVGNCMVWNVFFSSFSCAIFFFKILSVIHPTFLSFIILPLSIWVFFLLAFQVCIYHFSLFMYKTDTPSVYIYTHTQQ